LIFTSNDKKNKKANKKEVEKSFIIIDKGQENTEEEFRSIGVFGEINEEKCAEIVYALMLLDIKKESHELSDPENPESKLKTVIRPMELILCTTGGSADEMFAIYDVMRGIKKKCDIITRGLGKVMSAGVLLLAAGTKGKREIGKNCRVMIHGVAAGNVGLLHDLINEMDEIQHTQEAYIKSLVSETDMTIKQLKKMLDKKVNIYLTAQEAVELGIADIII